MNCKKEGKLWNTNKKCNNKKKEKRKWRKKEKNK